MIFAINPSVSYQRMEGFGASGAWWAQEVGNWECADQIAKLLYSKEDGIGLRTYRYNLGAGSAQSGNGEYSDRLRRAAVLTDENGKYNDNHDAAAVSMMKKCVNAGAKEVVLFVNSPPETLTKNGKAHTTSTKPFTANLSKKQYEPFVDYVLGATEHFLREGLPVRFISPVNEPFWIWTGGQEGCHYSPIQCNRLIRLFAKKMKENSSLRGVLLSGVENGDIRWFNHAYTHAFLHDKETACVRDGIDIHSYFLPMPLPAFMNDRLAFLRRYRTWMDKHYPNEKIRVSEWCHMQGGRDEGMASALETARVIAEDLTELNACAWEHWIACSPYEYCDGLIYFDLATKSFSLTKRYYATGQFSKFIPEGAKRIAIQWNDDTVSALAFEKNGQYILLFINPTSQSKTVETYSNGIGYFTDETHNLEKITFGKNQNIVLPPRSVMTLLTH